MSGTVPAVIDRVVAPAKLTLSLKMTGLREDGYHLIDAEMVTLDLHDELEIETGATHLSIHGAGEDVPLDQDNLVAKAMQLAQVSAGVRLTKRIPSMAGLGGGSADAAAVLRWAGFTDTEAAASIGADVAFCLVGGRARVTGIGEIVEPLRFVPRTFTLLTPAIPCPTPVVYAAWDEMGGPQGDHGNDLEPAALRVAPELARFRDELGDISGTRPWLAGSGSTWFVEGAFPGSGRVVASSVPSGWTGPDGVTPDWVEPA